MEEAQRRARCSGRLVSHSLRGQPVCSGQRTLPQDHTDAPGAQPLGPDVDGTYWKYICGPQACGPTFQTGPRSSGLKPQKGSSPRGRGLGGGCWLPGWRRIAPPAISFLLGKLLLKKLKSFRPSGEPPKKSRETPLLVLSGVLPLLLEPNAGQLLDLERELICL